MTLATCEAIVEQNGISPESIAANFTKWFRAGKLTGLGASTFKALRDLDAGAHWALSGGRGERAAGCGAAMRAAPLAFLLDPQDDKDRQTLRDICRITHHHEEACMGALAVVLAVRLASFQEAPRNRDWLVRIARGLPDCVVRDRLSLLAQAPAEMSIRDAARQHGCSGYAGDAVPLAIFAACSTTHDLPIDALRDVAAAGGDADTIASIAGQIIGTRIGADSIPKEMIESLADARRVTRLAKQFTSFVERQRFDKP